MSRRRRLPKIDPCKVNLKRMRRLSSDALMNGWARRGASAPSRTRVNSLLKGIVSNYATAKRVGTIYANDPVQKRRSQQVYLKITRNLAGVTAVPPAITIVSPRT